MSHLLKVIRPSRFQDKKKGQPLATEFPVEPELAPYLVTTTGALSWVVEPVKGTTFVRAANRSVHYEQLYQEIIESLISMGNHAQWGNVFPVSLDGVDQAIEHLKFFGLEDLEVLTPKLIQTVSAFDQEGNSVDVESVNDPYLKSLVDELEIPVRMCSWLPSRTLIVVPRDRDFVGVVNLISNRSLMACVHNASRGIAIVCER